MQVKESKQALIAWSLLGCTWLLSVCASYLPVNVYRADATSQANDWTLEQEVSSQAGLEDFKVLKVLDGFGESVSLDGDQLEVGAPGEDGYDDNSTGAVYIFKRTGTTWVLEQTILDQSSDFKVLKTLDGFGESVSLDGDQLEVGAPGEDCYDDNNTGAVYVFKWTGTTWVLDPGDLSGWRASLDEGRLAVGPGGDCANGGEDTGVVHIFKRGGVVADLSFGEGKAGQAVAGPARTMVLVLFWVLADFIIKGLAVGLIITLSTVKSKA